MMVCGWLAVFLGKELNWDLANYHYYNPFAFLHHRWGVDVWPASFVHVHLTPTLDILAYFLIQHLSPSMAVFMMGAIHGINFWLLFCIARVLLPNLIAIPLIISALGLYGPTAFPGIGSFQQDDLVSLFVLGFILLQLKIYACYPSHKDEMRLFLMSSMLLGLGVGGKLTAGVFVGGALFALLCLPFSFYQRVRGVTLLIAGVIFGVLCSSGYWMLFLWQHYHNPFFPLGNSFFHSPDFPFYNWKDSRFLPEGWMQTLFYPFYFSWDGRTGDLPFLDFRFVMVYLLFVLYGLQWTIKKIMGLSRRPLSIGMRWFFLFFIFSYVLWQYYFSIMRYLIPLEMLAPLVIYLLVFQLVQKEWIQFATIAALFMLLLGMMVPVPFVRVSWYGTSYFNVVLPRFVSTKSPAVVLMALPAYAVQIKPRPQTYLIPFFPAGWQFIGIPFSGKEYSIPENISAAIQRIQEKNIYLLTSPDYMPKMYQLAARIGFTHHGRCDEIFSDRQRVTFESVLLCESKKAS